MRTQRLIGWAGLLLGTALAQQPQTEVPLRVTYTAAAVLTPDAPDRELPFPVDSPVQASISVFANSSTLQVTLVDPGGAEHQAGNADNIVAPSYRFPVGAAGSGGQSHNFDVKNPIPGEWKVRLKETDFSSTRVAILTVYNIAGVGVALMRTGRDYPVNQPISLGLIVADGQGGLPRSAISSVTASLRADEGGPDVPITFADDGAGGDGEADDGSYMAPFTVNTPGSYSVIAKIQGVRNGIAFARTAVGGFRAVNPCGSIQPGVQSTLAGNHDALDVTLSVNAFRAGAFRLAATLGAPSGQRVSLSKTVPLESGLQAVTLRFPPSYLQALGVNGPFEVAEATLSCVENEGAPEVDVFSSDQRLNLGSTMPLEVAGAGRVDVSPGRLEFGVVLAGGGADRQLWISNRGTGVLVANSLAVDNAAFTVVAPAVPFTVLPNESRAVTLRFMAAAAGAQTGTLEIRSNDAAGITPVVPLAALATLSLGARAEASPGTLNFGTVSLGQSKDLTVTLRNIGGAPLTVSSLAADTPQFRVISPAPSFTLAPGEQQAVTVGFTAAVVGSQTGMLNIATDDPEQATVRISLAGTGLSSTPPAAVLFSDSFDRADADRCALGALDNRLGGSGTLYYLPNFPNGSTANPLGANIISNALSHMGKDYGGVQFVASANSCSTTAIRGKDVGQDMNIRVDVLVPSDSSGRVTQAGPYFRNRPAARGDGVLGGDSAGYWVHVQSTGEVKVKNLNAAAVVASSAKPASFDSTRFHTLEAAIRGTGLQVALDGQVVTFSQNGASVTTVSIPPTGGSNSGTAGILFGAEASRGQIGGQLADNLVVTAYRSLAP